MDFGIATVAAITAICYLAGLIVKASPWNNDKYIPIACGLWNAVMVKMAVRKGVITKEQYQEITGESYT